MYFVSIPWIIKKFYPHCVWEVNTAEKNIYLTFDDGPHPTITGFVLDELKKYDAKATFFCIGKNVVAHPDVYQRIISEGHSVGNHTYDHVNGYKTKDDAYLLNIEEAGKVIKSDLFRPPYGRITMSQIKKLRPLKYKIVLWSVLSGDFDKNISGEKCFSNVIKTSTSGSIIIFHDSEKAYDRLVYSLPLVLKYFSEKGFKFLVLSS